MVSPVAVSGDRQVSKPGQTRAALRSIAGQ
jgi:hypothetical protein